MSLTRDQIAGVIQSLTREQAQGCLWFLLGSIGPREVQAAIDHELRVNPVKTGATSHHGKSNVILSISEKQGE